jgi:hypothetical protein
MQMKVEKDEGVMIAFRHTDFEHLRDECRSAPLSQLLRTDPMNEDLRRVFEIDKTLRVEDCKEWPPHTLMILNRPTVVQVCCWQRFCYEICKHYLIVMQVEVLLHRRTNRLFVVATTHLYFDPLKAHIKLTQACVCARHVLAVADDVQKRHPTRRVLVVLAGDLNATPDSPLYTLLSTGKVSRDAAAGDWRCIDHLLQSTSSGTISPADNDKVCC